MARFLLSTRRLISLTPPNPPRIFSKLIASCSKASESFHQIQSDSDSTISSFSNEQSHRVIQLTEIIPSNKGNPLGKGFKIELMDSDLWGVSFGLAESLNSANQTPGVRVDNSPRAEEMRDFDDEIEDMRVRKKLFYKLDKGSKEFEENDIIFHRKKKSLIKKKAKENKRTEGVRPNDCKKLPERKNVPEKKRTDSKPLRELEKEKLRFSPERSELKGKRARPLTFNQLTDPYHLPFCLDIHVTKGSVRACVVHRITSKVVAVAHSISKDMKFDLNSKRDATACKAVGSVLAKRAIEDDIHNVIYTPRKGDRIVGKIEIVLRSIMDHGIDVKVKLKQKRPVKNVSVDQVDQAQ